VVRGKFDSTLVARVQQANDIVDVIGEHLSLAKKGKDFVGLCPFHTDHRPSMYVSPSKQIFKCFACSAGGDVIKFVQMREGLGFGQAVERLAERAGIKIERSQSQADPNEADPRNIARVNAWALKLWQANLSDEQKGEAARTYIAQRQITAETAKKWGLGLAIDSWDELVRAAEALKGPVRLLEQAGLVVARDSGRAGGGYYDKFRNRLMFPIWDVTGRVIAFGGRTLGNDPAKYMNSPATALFDKSNSLYGLNFARQSIAAAGTVVVVEGYTDCMMAHQYGCENVVATLGTSLTGGHARLLRRYASKIVLIFDSDVAGSEAANRALEVFLAEKIDIRIASVPQGKDPCDFLIAAGREAFEGVINNAVDVMEYKWHRLTEQFNKSDTIAGRKAAADEFLKATAAAMSAGKIDTISKGLIVSRLAGILGLGAAEINQELARRVGRLASSGVVVEENKRVVSSPMPQSFYERAQEDIVEVLLNRPEFYERVRERITVEMFDVPILRHIISVVRDIFESGQEVTPKAILAQCQEVETGRKVVELLDEGERKGNFDERLVEAYKAFEDFRSGSRRQNLGEDDESLREFAKRRSVNLRATGI
jgi:DNA primase